MEVCAVELLTWRLATRAPAHCLLWAVNVSLSLGLQPQQYHTPPLQPVGPYTLVPALRTLIECSNGTLSFWSSPNWTQLCKLRHSDVCYSDASQQRRSTKRTKWQRCGSGGSSSGYLWSASGPLWSCGGVCGAEGLPWAAGRKVVAWKW